MSSTFLLATKLRFVHLESGCLQASCLKFLVSRFSLGIVETLDSPNVGVCLDTVNSFGALEGPRVVLETLGSVVVNLHIKDFTIQRLPHSMGFTITGTPAGRGRLDIPWLVAELQRRDREFSGILELWPPPEATLAQTIAKERAWAEESAAYLHTLSATFG